MTTDTQRAAFETWWINQPGNLALNNDENTTWRAWQAATDAARGTAAEAMREAAAKLADHAMADHIADAIRALPLLALEVL